MLVPDDDFRKQVETCSKFWTLKMYCPITFMADCLLFYLPAHSTQRYISSKQHVNKIPFRTLHGFIGFFFINLCHNTNLAPPARGSNLHSLFCLNPEGPLLHMPISFSSYAGIWEYIWPNYWFMGRDSAVGVAYGRLDGSGFDPLWRTTFFAPFQTGSEAHPTHW